MTPLTRGTCCALVLVACSVASAREGPRLLTGADREGREVLEAARAFLAKVAEGDAEGARALFAGQAAHAPLVDAFARYGPATDRFDAARATLPRAQEQEHPTTNIIRMRMPVVPGRLLVLNGEEASLAGAGMLDFPVRMRRVGGTWKVSELVGDEARPETVRMLLDAFAAAGESVAAKAKAGQFESADAAMKAFNAEMDPAIGAWLKETDAAREAEANDAAADAGAARASPEWAPPSADDIAAAVGQSIFSGKGAALLASLPATPHLSQGQGTAYFVCHEAGMEISCVGEGTLVRRVVLYAGGARRFRRYPGGLPRGLEFEDRRREVERKLGRPVGSAGGTGKGRYWATYDDGRIDIEYTNESARDGNNLIRFVGLATPKHAGREVAQDGAAKRGPALAFRLVAEGKPGPGKADRADGIDVFPHPDDRAGGATVVRLEPEILLDETAVERVSVLPTGENFDGPLGIGVWMTEAGGEKFGEVTGKNVGRRLGIVIAGRLVSAPVIRNRIGRHVLIEMGEQGDGDDEARDLCGRLHAAVFALPE